MISFNILYFIHSAFGRPRRNRTDSKLKLKYCDITNNYDVTNLHVLTIKIVQSKMRFKTYFTFHFQRRSFEFILNYQEHIKVCVFRVLTNGRGKSGHAVKV